MCRSCLGYALIILGVAFNNLVYLQDLWLGQDSITLDSWKAIGGIMVGIAMVLIGMVLVRRAASRNR